MSSSSQIVPAKNKKERKTHAIYAITKHSMEIVHKLAKEFTLKDDTSVDFYISPKFLEFAPSQSHELSLPMGKTLQENFSRYHCHIFIISIGAVVRMVKDYLINKKVDPAIICIDDKAQFVIPVLSGHIGRGNAFAKEIADFLGSTAVITTASDVQGTFQVDILGRELSWILEDDHHNVTRSCAAVVNEEPVAFVHEVGEREFWPMEKQFPKNISYFTKLEDVKTQNFSIILIASDRDIKNLYPECWKKALLYRPKTLVLGLGCDKDLPFSILERGITKIMKEKRMSLKSIKSIATIDKKSKEPAFLELSEKYKWPLVFFAASDLDRVEGIRNPSETVKKYIGTRSVAEAASLLGAKSKNLLIEKQSYNERNLGKYEQNMTLALSRIDYPKRK